MPPWVSGAGDGSCEASGEQIKPRPGTMQKGERVVRMAWEICTTIMARRKNTMAMTIGHLSKIMHILPISHINLRLDTIVLDSVCWTSSQSKSGSRGARVSCDGSSTELAIVGMFTLCCGRFCVAAKIVRSPCTRRFLDAATLDRDDPAGLKDWATCTVLFELPTSSHPSSPMFDLGCIIRRLPRSACVMTLV